VPFDVAFAMDATKRQGLAVIFGELEGGEFDLQSMSWKERK
jgi:hypothetical protein